MSWFKKLLPSRAKTDGTSRRTVPEGVWSKCDECSAVLYRAELKRNLEVCPECFHHMLISARVRIEHFLDTEPQVEIGSNIKPVDKLKFRDKKKYKDRLSQAQKQTKEEDALVVMMGQVNEIPLVVAVFEYNFMAGSMGAVVGEKFVLATEAAIENNIPLVCFSASGGARMQEAILSLMQMAKTSSAVAKLVAKGLPYISVLTNPTMGGVSASLATLGDINIAEPNALIGFAGPRVIEQTVRETLPEGFQKSEFLLEHGMIDMILDRREMREKISSILSILCSKQA